MQRQARLQTDTPRDESAPEATAGAVLDSPPLLRVALVIDQFPAVSETFVAEEARALRELGHRVRIESREHARTPNPSAAKELEVWIAAEDRILRKAIDLAWLVAHHPLRSVVDLLRRRRWRSDEPVRRLRSLAPVARRVARAGERHLHVHFAAGAALDAMRLGRLLGIPYSVMAHAYDIYRQPTNLRDKLVGASFAVSGSDFTVRHLRAVVGEAHAHRIHKLVLGVDPSRFRRRTPYPGGRVAGAVGRLVEKKGFIHLIEATALLRESSVLERVVVVGGGPLADDLRSRADRLGVADAIEWRGTCPNEVVREVLEHVDVLVVPCVVAKDGDRDSSPVVVKEALAMEVPVVASDGFGIEEVVCGEWGKLVPPGRSDALAAALDELLQLPAERRAASGRAGRQWIVQRWNLYNETEKLVGLIHDAAGASQPVGRRAASSPSTRDRG